MKKIIGLILIVVLIAVLVSSNKKDDKFAENSVDTTSTASSTEIVATTTPMASSTPMTASTTMKTYKISDVAMHKDAKSCFTVIKDEVFDLTTWIKQHPGGDKAILSVCGIDGSKAFEGQHGGKIKIEMKLDTFKIGNLVK